MSGFIAIELAAFGLLMLSSALLWQGQGLLARAEQMLLELAVQQHEWVRHQQSQAQLDQLQEQAEATVEHTTRLVQTVHHGIAAIPFEVLEAIPATRDTSRLVRAVHDLTADSVYGSISAVNKGLGHGLRRLRRSNPDADE